MPGELERYGDSYRLCYVRGPEAIIDELAEQIGGRFRPTANRLASASGRPGAVPDATVSKLDEGFHVENGRLAPLTMGRALERCGPRHQETTMPKHLLLKRSRKD